jgi:hypothetical protein
MPVEPSYASAVQARGEAAAAVITLWQRRDELDEADDDRLEDVLTDESEAGSASKRLAGRLVLPAPARTTVVTTAKKSEPQEWTAGAATARRCPPGRSRGGLRCRQAWSRLKLGPAQGPSCG